jgi:23S rRNA (uracil1939-C5)-methyltransferase
VRLTRNVRSFFQSNRFLIEPLVGHVAELVPPGPVIDLYAGIGLFGLALTAAGESAVTLVEGDVSSGADLEINAALLGDGVRVLRRKVEIFLAGESSAPDATVIVDPPRTGLSKEVISGLLALSPATLVYVSCDAPTLARDTKRFLSAGYALDALTVFDLFPNTSHVETVVRFYRA